VLGIPTVVEITNELLCFRYTRTGIYELLVRDRRGFTPLSFPYVPLPHNRSRMGLEPAIVPVRGLTHSRSG
jgi:hypothetical protein